MIKIWDKKENETGRFHKTISKNNTISKKDLTSIQYVVE